MTNPDWPPNIQAVFKRMAPASKLLGLEIIDVNKEERWINVAFNASNDLCNMWGGIQGGMVAAMLDDVLSLAVGLDLEWGQISPTLELKVNMMAPTRPGRILAQANVIKRGGSVGFVEGSLFDVEGKLLATASSTVSYATIKKRDGDKEKTESGAKN